MKTLTTSVNLGSANRWRVLNADPQELIPQIEVTVQLINNGNAEVSRGRMFIRNGLSDRVQIDSGTQRLSDALLFQGEAVSTATGYTDALTAWRSGSTMSQRRDAIESWMLTAGVAAANMAGT